MPDWNPEVALGVNPPAPPPNPLGTVGAFAQIQNQLNQNRLFQQTFAAKQQAGQIISSAPDLETGLTNLYKNPSTAAFAPEIVNNVRQSQLTLTQMQGIQQTQANTGLELLMKSIASTAGNPSMLPSAIQRGMATLPPGVRDQVAGIMPATVAAILPSGAGNDPSQWTQAQNAQYTKNLAALAATGGLTPDTWSLAAGKPTVLSQGNQLTPGLTSLSTGAVTPSGGSFGVGAPAGYQSINGVPVAAPAVSAGGGSGLGQGTGGPAPGPAGNPSTGPLGNVLANANANVPGETPQPSGGASGASLAGDGKPLIPPGLSMVSPSAGTGLGGVRVLTQGQSDINKALISDYNDEGLKAFKGAQQSQASLQYLDAGFDNLVKGGGFLTPGAAEGFRGDFAKTINTLAQMTGKPPPFDPTKVASIEDMTKETTRMGVAVTNSMLGQQREAAQTIVNMTSSVPGISNTYMGGKVVISGIQATMQRLVDERNFSNAWQQANQGNLTGAAEAFNQAHPAVDYARGALGKFGMTEGGFQTPAAIKAAVGQGYLTPSQAKSLAQSQFGDYNPGVHQ
jgi:hypothetical protein